MPETTTDKVVDTSVADDSSTTDTTNTSADSQAPIENSSDNTTEVNSSASAEQNQSTENDEAAALASFARGQGINDLSELSDRERSLLKMARDNKSALDRTKQNQRELEESSTGLSVLGSDATDIQKLAAKVANMEFSNKKSAFFEGKDASLEPAMAKIIADKREEFGDDYARGLLNDLPTLYGLAQLQKKSDTNTIVEAAKRDERNSMNQSLSAGAGNADATNSKPATQQKVTAEWIRNEYNPNDPEHRAIVDAAIRI